MNERETFLEAVEIDDPAVRISCLDIVHAAAGDSHPRRRWPTIAAAMLVLAVGLGITEATVMAQLTSTVMRLTTGSGTLVIETDDPSVKVTIDDKEISIRGAGIEEFVFKPGQYQVAADKDGESVSQQLATITRGGKEVVRVTLEGNKTVTAISRNSTGCPADVPPAAIAPFDAKQAMQHQEAWAQYLGVPVEYTNSLGMTFRLIPPGEFMMGSTPEEIDKFVVLARKSLTGRWKDFAWPSFIQSEGPQHRVRITKPFYLGLHEVTESQYKQIMGNIPSTAPHLKGVDALAAFPVDSVSWNECAEFCVRLNQKEMPNDAAYRLPTEAEWEYACRAGTATSWSNGDDDSALLDYEVVRANNNGGAHPVGGRKPNQFGLFDMGGNMMEWCADWYTESDYPVSDPMQPDHDPAGPESGQRKIYRGGSFQGLSARARSASRNAWLPTDRNNGIGFRVALTVESVKSGRVARPGNE